ncbi:MAG TPA: NAD(P)H-hydrate dehydratase [Candidatus Acidoferrales bacterium]|nr:NAD(P)H-hydrate dehydratase [Candidatus Acidoferrales bacterium]
MKALTTAEMRDVDRLSSERCSIPGLTLMENAGKSVAEWLQRHLGHLDRAKIIILCGRGNNGGDGFVAARHLWTMGAKPLTILFGSPAQLHGDAALSARRLEGVAGKIHVVADAREWAAWKPSLDAADVILDALLGTGAHGAPEGLLAQVIADVNRRRPSQSVLAVDIPSGLLADTGEAPGPAVAANATVTFTAPKIGMLLGLAADFVGQLSVAQIGSPAELAEQVGKGSVRWLDAAELSAFALPRDPFGHKGDYGHALIVAGSFGKTGAAVLAAMAALRSGAGLVTVATPDRVVPIIAAHAPELMTHPLPSTDDGAIALRSLDHGHFAAILKGKRALAVGPGLTTHDETQQFVRRIVAGRPIPVILDADGLNAFAGHAMELRGPLNDANQVREALAITPHPGEMARLLGCDIARVQSQRIELARKAASDWNVFAILKGHQTVIAAPTGHVWVNSTGNPGMATGGTGDALTGILAGLTAQYGPSSWASVLAFGVYLHGLAGDIAAAKLGQAPLIASDVIQAIPEAFRQFSSELDRA